MDKEIMPEELSKWTLVLFDALFIGMLWVIKEVKSRLEYESSTGSSLNITTTLLENSILLSIETTVNTEVYYYDYCSDFEQAEE